MIIRGVSLCSTMLAVLYFIIFFCDENPTLPWVSLIREIKLFASSMQYTACLAIYNNSKPFCSASKLVGLTIGRPVLCGIKVESCAEFPYNNVESAQIKNCFLFFK